MDFQAIDFGFATGSLAGVIMLTGIIKTVFNIPDRVVPIIPAILGFAFGILDFLVTGDLGSMAWYQAVASTLMKGLIYAGVGSYLFKVYKTTIKGK